MNSLKI